jgi:hypothetical protein
MECAGMSVQDLELNCHVRGVLARHWIDSNRISFHTRRGHVQLAGELRVIGAPKNKERTAGVLQAVESEIRRVQAVRTVSFELTNWIRDECGGWVCTEATLRPHRASAAQAKVSDAVEIASGMH